MKIGIGIPSAGEWVSGFGLSLAGMIGFWERLVAAWPEDKRPETVVIGIDGHLPEVRHHVLREAIMEDCTHLLWLDADMIFPNDTLPALLQHNLPIVGCNYPRRTFPCIPTAHAGGPDADAGMVFTDEAKTGLEKVKHLGMGCLLTDMRVYDAVEPPYFVFEPAGKYGLSMRGEDVYFMEKAGRAGIEVYCDHDLSRRIGHVGSFVYTHGLANALRSRAGGTAVDVASGDTVAEDRSAAA